MLKSAGGWWRETTVYQIYPRSFIDSNGDGIGDIPGIISKLDYIKDTGFGTIWVSPFFASPQQDFGYDISDYYSCAPEYGTQSDIDRLIAEVHARGMYIVFDMVLNHTSDQHPWFIESRSSKNNPKRDWYVWKDGQKPDGSKPPTNWRSQVSGSGWQRDEGTGQWYWTAFLPFQPDLNYRNPEVKAEMFKMLKHWLDKGVDGFRLDIIGSVFEDKEFRDSPFSRKLFPDEANDGMFFRSTCRTQNLPESMDFAKDLRKLLDGYDSPQRFLVGETFGNTETISRFCRGGGLHSAFAFECAGCPFTAAAFRKLIRNYEQSFSEPLLPVWAFSNHDRSRRISELGGDIKKTKLSTAFQLTVRGLPFFYFGEEIGMTNTKLNHRDSLDPVSFPFRRLPSLLFNFADRKVHGALNRDKVRTPMLWDNSPNAGFTGGAVSPWLPVSPDYPSVNAEAAKADPDSIYHCFRSFLGFRKKSAALRRGIMIILPPDNFPPEVLSYIREDALSGEKLLVLLNFSDKGLSIPAEAITRHSPEGRLLLSTRCDTAYSAGSLRLSSFEAVVIG